MATLSGRWMPAPNRPTEVFVGRRAELAAVREAWHDVQNGAARIVGVEGASGIGKTSLIARALTGLSSVPVVWVTADETETDLRLGVLDRLTDALPSTATAGRSLLGPAGRSVSVDPWVVGAELLGALFAAEPLVLVLDDVGSADDASTRALLYALRRLHAARILVLLGFRRDDDAVPDSAWDRLLTTHPGTRRLRLDGLDPVELSELAAALHRALGSTGAAHRLWDHTRGHPLHFRALLDELPPEVLAGTDDVLPAPRSLSAVVLVRLARAGPPTRELVAAVSVLGQTCVLHHAADLAGLADPVQALDDAVALGLLAERPRGSADPVGRPVGFVHPLLRAAVYRDLPPARRRALHRHAATIVASGAPVLALRHRVAAASAPDPQLAAELATLAGPDDSTAGMTGAEAADLLRRAAELSEDRNERERFLLDAVTRLLVDGEIARALAMEAVVEHGRPGPRRSTVLGQLAILNGRFDRARAVLAEVPVPGPEPRPGPAVTAQALLALLAILEGDPERAVALAGPVLVVPGVGAEVRAPAGFAVVLALAATGRSDQAHAVLDGAASRPGAGDADLLVVRGILAALAGDDAAAAGALGAAVDRARTGEPVRSAALGLAFRAAVHDRIGPPDTGDTTARIEDPVEALELAVALARDGGTALARALAESFAAEALAVRGRIAEARAHLRAARSEGPGWWGGDVCAAVAAAVLAEETAIDDPPGDPELVLRELAPALRPRVRAITDGLGMLAPRVLEVDALLDSGKRERAVAALAELDRLLAGPGRSPTRDDVDAVRLHLLLGDELDLPRRAGVRAPMALARLESELGLRRLETGERRAGVDLLRSARDTFARLGAAGRRRRCEEALHAAGLTPPSDDEALGLTGHEQAVVDLVTRGLTNREVGRALFITPRTVAYHLSNVYAKLGVTSRRQLRDLVAER